MPQVTPLQVFYDGGCGVCAAEIRHYRRIADPDVVGFVDIAAPEFDAAEYGPSPTDFQAQLHVRDATGRFYTGVEAFQVLWMALPPPLYPLLARLTALPGIRALARFAYAGFARYRHLLPGNRPGPCTLPEPGEGSRRDPPP